MNDRLPKALAVAAAMVLSLAGPAFANHPEREWKVKRSEHFALHYYDGLENTSARILAAAEAHYARLAKAFGVTKPSAEPIPIIITHDSFFNGEAEPIKDRITLDPGLASSSIVGTERFVAHELAHVMTFQALDKGNKLAQLNNLGGLPTWFLEGVAQYAAEYWYPSTDRMLRLATLEHRLLTSSERANFRVLGVYAGAAGYNEGFALCRYMFETEGPGSLATLMEHLRSGKRSFASAIEATFGKTLPAIESGWRASLQTAYAKQIQGMAAVPPEATKLVPSESECVSTKARLSPDGKRLAYLSSAGQDRFLYLRGNLMGMLSLFVSEPDGRNAKRVPAPKGMLSDFCWSADGKSIAYAAIAQDKDGNPVHDAFVVSLATGKTTRLTTGGNVQSVAWRPRTGQVAVVTVTDGQNRIRLFEPAKPGEGRVLLAGDADAQYRDLAWRPDGSALALSTYAVGGSARLALLDPEGGKLTPLTAPGFHENDTAPAWTPDGRLLVFVSDRGGMANLYQLSLLTRAVAPLTHVYRGAEAPSLSPDGKRVLFTSFKAQGAEIYALDREAGLLSAAGPLVARVASAFRAASAPLAPAQMLPGHERPADSSALAAEAPAASGAPATKAPEAPVSRIPAAKDPAAAVAGAPTTKASEGAVSALPATKASEAAVNGTPTAKASEAAMSGAPTAKASEAAMNGIPGAKPREATVSAAPGAAERLANGLLQGGALAPDGSPTAPEQALNASQTSDAPLMRPIVLPAPGMPDFRSPVLAAPSAPPVPLRSLDDAVPYRSTLTNDLLVPQMTSDERGQQVGVAANYSDILNQHQLGMDVRYGLFSQRFSYLFNYVNRMAPFTWQLSLFDQPQIALSPDIGATGRPITEGLYYQRRRGVGASALFPLGGSRSLISGVNFGTLDTLMAPYIGDYGQLRQGALNTLSLAYGEARVESTVDADANPADGYRLVAGYTLSDHRLGSAFDFSQYTLSGERYFNLVPSLQHHLTWRFNGGLINGDAVLPFLLGGASGANPIFALRGYATGAFTGNRIATTGLEYTLPLSGHLDKSFGPLYFDRVYLSAFGDLGAAWNGGAQALPAASAGLELKIRTVMMGQMLNFRLGAAQRLGSGDLPGFYLTF